MSDERQHVDVTRDLTVSWGGSKPIVVSCAAPSAPSFKEAVEIGRRAALMTIDAQLSKLAERAEELRRAREVVEAWDPPEPDPKPSKARRGARRGPRLPRSGVKS